MAFFVPTLDIFRLWLWVPPWQVSLLGRRLNALTSSGSRTWLCFSAELTARRPRRRALAYSRALVALSRPDHDARLAAGARLLPSLTPSLLSPCTWFRRPRRTRRASSRNSSRSSFGANPSSSAWWRRAARRLLDPSASRVWNPPGVRQHFLREPTRTSVGLDTSSVVISWSGVSREESVVGRKDLVSPTKISTVPANRS
jgi:hypothetical protein